MKNQVYNQFESDADDVSVTPSLSEGSSALTDKGTEIFNCDSGSFLKKPVYDLKNTSWYSRRKLASTLLRIVNGEEESYTYGGVKMNDEEVSKVPSFSNKVLANVQPSVVPLLRTTWEKSVREEITKEDVFTVFQGSTGMGKTFSVPEFVAQTFNYRVYLVQPTYCAAYHVFRSMKGMGRCVYFDKDGAGQIDSPAGSVVVGTATSLLSRMLKSKGTHRFSFDVVYIDEYHFDTAPYEVLKRMIPHVSHSVKIVAASATPKDGSTATRYGENTPSIEVRKIRKMVPRDYAMGRFPTECHPGRVESGKWVYVLPNHDALLSSYSVAGNNIDKYYMTSKLPASVNSDALMAFNRHNGKTPALMFVTPEFGSMYTFDCDYLFDSGATEDVVVHSNVGVTRRLRYCTFAEALQRQGRLGRCGRAGVYYTWQEVERKSGDSFHKGVINTSLKDYYMDLYMGLLEFTIGRDIRSKFTRNRAFMLLNTRCISYTLRGFVADNGKIHRFMKEGADIFFRSKVIDFDMTFECEQLHTDVHIDYEKKSFIYHYLTSSPTLRVTQYDRMFFSVCDSTVPKGVIKSSEVTSMDEILRNNDSDETIEVLQRDVANDGDSHRRDLGNINSKETSQDVVRPSGKKNQALARTLVDSTVSSVANVKMGLTSIFKSVQTESNNDVDISSEDSEGIVQTSVETSTDNETHGMAKKNSENDLRNAESSSSSSPSTKKLTNVPEGYSNEVISQTAIAPMKKPVKKNPNAVSDMALIKPFKPSTPVSGQRLVGWEISYNELDAGAREYISIQMPIPPGMHVPFMTLYGEPVGRFNTPSDFKVCPVMRRPSVDELRALPIILGYYYTPLLSTVVDKNYREVSVRDKRRVSRMLKCLDHGFFRGSLSENSEDFDTFVRVWNDMTRSYLECVSQIAALEKCKEDSTIISFFKPSPLKYFERTFEQLSKKLMRLQYYYIEVMRPIDLLLVPCKSRGICEETPIERWLDRVYTPSFPIATDSSLVPWKFDPDCDSIFGGNIYRVRSSNSGGMKFGYAFYGKSLFISKHVVSSVNDYDDMNYGNISMLVPKKALEFVLENIDGVCAEGCVTVASKLSDIAVGAVYQYPNLEYDGPTFEQCSTTMYVKVITILFDEKAQCNRVYSVFTHATYDKVSKRGVCAIQFDRGMSGSLVVSAYGNAPLGMLEGTSVGEDGRGHTIFSVFSDIIEDLICNIK